MTEVLVDFDGLETKKEMNGSSIPYTESVSSSKIIFGFDEPSFAYSVEQYIDTDKGILDERVALLVEIARDLPNYTANFITQLAQSDDTEHLILTSTLIKYVLRQGVASGKLSNDDMDQIRDTWAKLMCSEDEEASEVSTNIFMQEIPNFIDRDMVTFERIGWVAVPNVILIKPFVNKNLLAIQAKAAEHQGSLA